MSPDDRAARRPRLTNSPILTRSPVASINGESLVITPKPYHTDGPDQREVSRSGTRPLHPRCETAPESRTGQRVPVDFRGCTGGGLSGENVTGRPGFREEPAISQEKVLPFDTSLEIEAMTASPGGVNGEACPRAFVPSAFHVADPHIAVPRTPGNVSRRRIEVLEERMESAQMGAGLRTLETGDKTPAVRRLLANP